VNVLYTVATATEALLTDVEFYEGGMDVPTDNLFALNPLFSAEIKCVLYGNLSVIAFCPALGALASGVKW